ncbi:MAG: cobalt-precorrin-6A reductase, partial [Dongiaceae bacterium]
RRAGRPGAVCRAMNRILILGGTSESAQLAKSLSARPGIHLVSSLAGATSKPAPLDGVTRIGGFGGIEGLAQYLRDEKIELLIDATHPYATQISRHALQASRTSGTPLLRLERPPWTQQSGDRWIQVESWPEAARLLPDCGRRVFVTIGTKELQAFARIERMWFLVRMIESPTGHLPLPNYQVELGRGPFDAAAEQRLLTRHRIEVIVSKNSGGDATYGKIAAARALGLPVLLLRRPRTSPAMSATKTVASVSEALSAIDRGI